MAAKYGTKPFQEANDYFRQKHPLPTTGWQDVYGPQHDHAFMVAGANKSAIVEDFATAIQKALDDGETLADFRKRFDDIVERHGWDYNGSRGWRSRLIYETNLRQAYNAGREKQFADPEFRQRFPYSEYRHSGAENFRPQHRDWDRLVLRVDDPWWDSHSPSNGYGCDCKKFALSERQLKRTGRDGPDTAPTTEYKEFVDKRTGLVREVPAGVDPGFEFKPGQSTLRADTDHFTESLTADTIPIGPASRPPLPPPTPASESLLMADDLAPEEYVNAFLGEFGTDSGLTFFDAVGEPIAINDYLFKDPQGRYKVQRRGDRHRYVRILARALIEPDEIWAILEQSRKSPGKFRIKRRYIKRWVIEENGEAVEGFSAFERVDGAWSGSTIFQVDRGNDYLEQQRQGVLLYQRGQEQEGE